MAWLRPSVTNFSMNHELKMLCTLIYTSTHSLINAFNHLRKGVLQSWSKKGQNGAIFVNFLLFFVKFLQIFYNFLQFFHVTCAFDAKFHLWSQRISNYLVALYDKSW